MTASVAPALAACLMKVAATGWFSVALAPATRMKSAFKASEKGLLTAPEPMVCMRAATELAWQSRVQWSTLFVPNTARMSFWKR